MRSKYVRDKFTGASESVGVSSVIERASSSPSFPETDLIGIRGTKSSFWPAQSRPKYNFDGRAVGVVACARVPCAGVLFDSVKHGVRMLL